MQSVMMFDEKNVTATVNHLLNVMPSEKTEGVNLQEVLQVAAIEKFCELYGKDKPIGQQINDESKLIYLGLWSGVCCTFSVSENGSSSLSQPFELSEYIGDWKVASCSFYIYAN
ncbi:MULTISPECIES: hypothetical protein [Vibrio]|uniref:hypothetical protein n=1 Tax=Vibrio TaxID=662 RepID=UPI00223F4855|nr:MULTISPECIES: hypothetical protein [Vibrio]MDL1993288.1 hypothetical protein [Vibrio parahaemolyticus]MDW1465458.1 hypothetical protein [Vibrio sp. YT-16]MDW2254863.1 hypothetical protein [Vibrio sp. 1569]